MVFRIEGRAQTEDNLEQGAEGKNNRNIWKII